VAAGRIRASHWNFYPTGDGYYEIWNQNSCICLTTDGIAGYQLYQTGCQDNF
jgi:hypothetical protein